MGIDNVIVQPVGELGETHPHRRASSLASSPRRQRKRQAVARTMIEAGVKAILNYAPITLTVPSNVRVQYIDPVVGLQRMTYYL